MLRPRALIPVASISSIGLIKIATLPFRRKRGYQIKQELRSSAILASLFKRKLVCVSLKLVQVLFELFYHS